MNQRSHKLAVWALIAVSGLGLGAGRSVASDGALAIIFDGSGSMWGRLGQGPQSKLAAAREGVAQALPASPAHVGLVTFGRRRGDCTDVELVASIERGDRQRITAPLERLNPRGRGPITLALRTAAKALEGHPGARHVLIIHDEPDNCSLDACAAAAELKAADPALIVSTVMLGTPPEDARAMACLAERTGGRSFLADTPQDAIAAISAAVRFASLETARPTEGVAADPGDRRGPSRVRLTARLGAGGQPITQDVTWRIWPAASTGATIAESSSATFETALEPGAYRLEMRSGLVTARQDFEIKVGGVTPVEVVLDAGRLRMAPLLRRGGHPHASARIAIRQDQDIEAQSPAIWMGTAGELLLPPGSYRVRAAEGRAHNEQRITIRAGQSASVDLATDMGRIAFSAAPRDGTFMLDDILLRILEADPEAPGGFREVYRTTSPTADVALPAGTYQLAARIGSTETRERVSLSAGDEVKHTFRIAVGRVTLAPAGAEVAVQQSLRFRFQALDVPTADVIQASDRELPVTLAAGRYRLDVRMGIQTIATQDIEVRSGAEQRLTLPMSLATVELRAADSIAGLALAESFWEIANVRGDVVWRSASSKPRAVLVDGRYTARLFSKGRRFEKPFEVASSRGSIVVVGE
jgi:Ca-activated chloride channel family protein